MKKTMYIGVTLVLMAVMLWQVPAISQSTITWEGIIPHIYSGATGDEAINIAMTQSTVGLDVSEVSALTNTVQEIMSLTHTTSGSPANGIGLEWAATQETSASNNEDIGSVGFYMSDVTAASEDASFSVELMANGATKAQKFSVGSTGIVTLVGATTLDNTTASTLTVTETNIGLVGATTVTGAVTISGAVTAPSLLLVDGTEASGGLTLKTFTASSGALTGATDKIEVNIPTGSVIVACQLRVDVAVTNAGDNTWAAAYSGGSTAAIQAAGGAAAKNTKVNTFFDANTATAITASETDITLTPQGADFTAGEITAVVYYYILTPLDSAA